MYGRLLFSDWYTKYDDMSSDVPGPGPHIRRLLVAMPLTPMTSIGTLASYPITAYELSAWSWFSVAVISVSVHAPTAIALLDTSMDLYVLMLSLRSDQRYRSAAAPRRSS